MRPYLEILPWEPHASVCLLDRRLADGIPFQWHHHPEYELTLTMNSCGQRFIGDHVEPYEDGDLVLVGPNLPHTWVSQSQPDETVPHLAKVIWFGAALTDAITSGPPDFAAMRELLARGKRGICFRTGAGAELKQAINALFTAPPTQRVVPLLGILERLAARDDAEPLASRAADTESSVAGRERIDRVLVHIHMNYARPLPLEELAEVAALSVSGLHRLFWRHTQLRISDYLKRMRIGDACAQLSATDRPIGFIAEAVGYASLANFNRQFKELRGITPSAYRAAFQAGSPVRPRRKA